MALGEDGGDRATGEPCGTTPLLAEAREWFVAQLGHEWEHRCPPAVHFGLAFANCAPEGVRLWKTARALPDGPALQDVVFRLGQREWASFYAERTDLEVAASLQAAGGRIELVRPRTAGNVVQTCVCNWASAASKSNARGRFRARRSSQRNRCSLGCSGTHRITRVFWREVSGSRFSNVYTGLWELADNVVSIATARKGGAD